MLGWEYPPHISGGLGVACEGLTKALAKLDIKISFLFPNASGDESCNHMELIGLSQSGSAQTLSESESEKDNPAIQKQGIPSQLMPYLNEDQYQNLFEKHLNWIENESGQTSNLSNQNSKNYSINLFEEVHKFSASTNALADQYDFDLIHAHDWMTFPAAVELSKKTNKPLVLHVHSIEHDRGAFGGDQRIQEVEKNGLKAADLVICVSQYTKSRVQHFYQIPDSKVVCIHNGLELSGDVKDRDARESVHKIKTVLYLGRVTYQKGPEYFIEMAKELLKTRDDVCFKIAGNGDLLLPIQALIQEEGLEEHFEILGFISGKEKPEVWKQADVFVMPSVSEPFGLTAIEALDYGVPTIITKQSGVSEVLNHALKYNFWDTKRLTRLVDSLLDYPEVRNHIALKGKQETENITWEKTALKVKKSYDNVLNSTNAISI